MTINRQSLTVETHEFHREGRQFRDENMTITPVYLYPAGHTPVDELDESPLMGSTPNLKRKSEDDLQSPTGYALKKLLLHHMFGSGGTTAQKPAADLLREQEDSIMVMPARSDSAITVAPLNGGADGDGAGTGTGSSSEAKEAGEAYGPGSGTLAQGQNPSAPSNAMSANEAKKMEESARHLAQRAELKRLGTNRLPQARRNPVALCYVCEGPTVPGKFDAVAAKKLGIKPGPDCGTCGRALHISLNSQVMIASGRLARGESVTLENGTVVEPHQCVGPARPGAVGVISIKTDLLDAMLNLAIVDLRHTRLPFTCLCGFAVGVERLERFAERGQPAGVYRSYTWGRSFRRSAFC